jgi:hypothetical protein
VRAPVDYHGVKLANAFAFDFFVEARAIVEVNSVEK